MEKTTKKNEKLIKVLQILSALFMLSMVVTMLVLMKKFNINIDNAAEFATYIKGGTFTVGLIIIAFTVIKSFALVFPPAVIFAVSGLLIDNLWVAILIISADLQARICLIPLRKSFRKSKIWTISQGKTSLWLFMS